MSSLLKLVIDDSSSHGSIVMAALQPIDTSIDTSLNRNVRSGYQHRRPPRQQRSQRSQQRPHPHHQWIATEISVQLMVNGILSILAVFTLLKLFPYQVSQQEKLKEVRTQVQETEWRVNQLRQDFSRNFDPHQAKKIMQENSSLIEPNQRRIYWK